jgi:hypothetical protein
MPERMVRLYGWLQKHVNHGFNSAWPNSAIETHKPKIETSIQLAANTLPASEMRSDLLTDLMAVYNRPSNILTRIPNAGNVVNTVVNAPVADAALDSGNAQGLIAVTESESTGAVVYWSLAGDLDLGVLGSNWEGINPDWIPSKPSTKAAFSRAAKDEQNRRILVRSHVDGGYQFVAEIAHADKPLEYIVGPRLVLNAADKVVFSEDSAAFANRSASVALLDRVTLAYEKACETVDSKDVSVWLTGICKALNAVSLRATGGVYFIPRDSIDLWHKIKGAVSVSSAHKVFEIPALKSDDAIQAILEAINSEVMDMDTAIRGEILDGIGARKAANRVNEIGDLIKKIAGYEKLLSKTLTGPRETLDKLGKELAGKVGRFAMLEAD